MLLHRPWNTKNWIDWHPLPKVIFSSNEVHNVGKSFNKSHFKNASTSHIETYKIGKKFWGIRVQLLLAKKIGGSRVRFADLFSKGKTKK